MTFEELDKDLPNGFHDALVKKITLDFLDRSIIFEMELWVGDLNGPVPEKRRNGRLRLISPYFCQIEPPVPGYTFMPRKESVSIDSDSSKRDRVIRWIESYVSCRPVRTFTDFLSTIGTLLFTSLLRMLNSRGRERSNTKRFHGEFSGASQSGAYVPGPETRGQTERFLILFDDVASSPYCCG